MNFRDLDKLPSPPGVAVKLLEIFSEPEVTLDELNDVIGIDPALTARVIKYANSPMFARRHDANTLQQATMMLGANGVKMIALSFSLTEIKQHQDGTKFEFNKFWNASLATAVCNQNIYEASGRNKDEGFLIGLLANIGQLAMFCCRPNEYEDAMGDLPVFSPDLVKAEQAVFGANRYALGADVLEEWNFPTAVVQTLKQHSDPTTEGAFSARALEMANRMAYVFLSDMPDYTVVGGLNQELVELFDNAIEDAELFFANSMAMYREIASVLSYDCPEHKSLAEIELEAKTRIIELSMNLHCTNEKMTAQNDELKDMAYIDQLTKIGNRRQYESIGAAELNRCSRTHSSFGLIVIDIDHFKSVNDTYGHAAGDRILQDVARLLTDSLRRYDFAFRYGGEEFVVVLPEADAKTVELVAERLRSTIEESVFEFEGQAIPVTISLGGVVFQNAGVEDLDSLFKRADTALYYAKESGRNQFKMAERKLTVPDVKMGTPTPAGLANSVS